MPRRVIRSYRSMPVGYKLGFTLLAVVVMVVISIIGVTHEVAKQFVLNELESNLGREVWHIKQHLKQSIPASSGHSRDLVQTMVMFAPGRAPGQGVSYLVGSGGDVVLPELYEDTALPDRQTLARLVQQATGFETVDIGGEDYFLMYEREPVSGKLLVVQVADNDALLSFKRLRLFMVLLASVLGAGLALFAIVITYRSVTKPLKHLTNEAERVAAGDMTPPEVLNRRDELGRLSRSLRKMTIASREMIQSAENNEKRFRRLFSDTRDAAFIIDGNDRLTDLNPAGRRIFGMAPNDDHTDTTTGFFFADPTQYRQYLDQIHKNGYVQNFSARMKRRNGEEFEASITATSRGEGLGRFGLLRDVTEIRKAEAELKANEERYRRLVENAPSMVYRWSIKDKRFEYINNAAYRITGRTPKQIISNNNSLLDAIPEDIRSKTIKHWFAQISGDPPDVREQQFAVEDRFGGIHWIIERSITVRDEDGKPLYLEGISTEITRRKLLEEALRQGQRMTESTLAGLPMPVMVLDREHRVVHWNRAMERLTGIPSQKIVGTRHQWQPFYESQRPTLGDLILSSNYEGMEKYYGDKGLKRSALVEGSIECEDYFWGNTGQGRHLFISAAPITDEDGKIIRAVETLIDITDQKNLEQELRLISITDELTGLYNKRFFHATLSREMEMARRFDQPLTLLMMDLDRFKSYNDTYGHLEGDKALAKFANEIRFVVRDTDLPCRYGGEEFSVLLPRTDLDEAQQVAERLKTAVEEMELWPLLEGGERSRRHITVSIGVARLEPDMDQDQFIRIADRALYTAKQCGRNQVCRAPESALLGLDLAGE